MLSELREWLLRIAAVAVFGLVGYSGVTFLIPEPVDAAEVCGDEICSETTCYESVGHFCWHIPMPGDPPGCTGSSHC
jgi:hypothetical protein